VVPYSLFFPGHIPKVFLVWCNSNWNS